MRRELTAERLRALLFYRPETGIFFWREARGGVMAGDPAGCIDYRGRIRITVDGGKYFASRLAWIYMTWQWLWRD